jgi:hypothetical protein
MKTIVCVTAVPRGEMKTCNIDHDMLIPVQVKQDMRLPSFCAEVLSRIQKDAKVAIIFKPKEDWPFVFRNYFLYESPKT